MSQKPATQLPRKRQLNVVYFVDSSRTRSFRLPLRRLNVLLFLFVSVLTWSVASVILIGFLIKDRMDVTEQLQDSLAVIFDYETRYERVYEKAYPADGRLVKQLAEEKADRQVNTEPKALVSVNNATAAATAAGEDATETEDEVGEDGGEPAASEESAASSTHGDEISIEDPVVEETGDALEIRFKIKNENSPDRVEGFVWAVADFRGKDGNKTHIGSPSTIDVAGDGKIMHKERAHRFSIRHYKRKQFRFPFPKDQQGTITAIHIGVQYRDGKENLFDVPVDIQVGSKVEVPDTEKKSG